MRSLTRQAAVIAVLGLLAACDDPKPRSPPSDDGAPAFMKAQKPAAPPAPAPPDGGPQPSWAAILMGKRLSDEFPAPGAGCIGNTDAISARYSAAVRVEGWAWDSGAKAAVAHVLLADRDGKIVGGGQTGIARPDVVLARKEVTAPETGWSGVAALTKGPVRAFAVLNDGKSLCPLGQVSAG